MPTSIKKLLSSKYTAIAIILIISVGVYLNTLPNGFVYDDEYQVLENQWIRNAKYIPQIFLTNVWAFVSEEINSNYYRPLMHITYMIDYYIFGLNPWGFHLTNIIFHTGVTVLIFLIVSTLVNQFQISNLKSEILNPAFIAALLFAVHPIHTEAVSWVGGVPELLFTLFYLLSFYLYIYPVRDKSLNGTKTDRIQDKRFILSIFFFFLATLCKETALTLPILLLVYDYSFRKDTLLPISSKTLYQLLKRYLPYLIVSGIYIILRIYALRGLAPEKRHAELSNYEYFINIFPLFTQYLEKLILPINMNAFYVFHPISSILQWKGVITLLFTLGFVFLVYFFRRHKIVFFSLLWIVIPLLPALYIPALGENVFTDRYLYLPSAGFVMLTALSIERIYQFKALRQTANYVIISILVILTGLYSVETIKRNYIWRNDYTLWTDTVKKSPDGFMVHNNLGLANYNKKLIDKAIEHYQIALKLKPNHYNAYNNLGAAYYEKGDIDKAVEHYQTALKLKPNYYSTHNNLGVIYYEKGDIEKAVEHYQIALKLKPDYPEAHLNLGIAYCKQHRFDEAEKEYIIALELKPDYPEAHLNLGTSYFEQSKYDKAIDEYLIALKFNPDDAETHYNLGNAYVAQQRFEDAIKEYMIVIKLKPDYPEIHLSLGNVYSKQGKSRDAVKEYKIALELKTKASKKLGDDYFNQRRFDEAVKEYMFALELKSDFVEAHYSLGLVYLEMGLKHKGEEEFKTALKLKPDFTPAKEALELIKGER